MFPHIITIFKRTLLIKKELVIWCTPRRIQNHHCGISAKNAYPESHNEKISAPQKGEFYKIIGLYSSKVLSSK